MYEGFEQTVCVVNMKNIDQERVAVRYVADVPMTQNSKSVNPRLEDLYLWIFRDTTEGRGGLS